MSTPPSSSLPDTRWDWIEQLRAESGGATSRAALALLCEGYWYPVFARLRSQGHSREVAEDITQGFFEKLIRTRAFETADPAKGRLRSLLLTSLSRYVGNLQDAEWAQKRGGRERIHLPIFSTTEWAEQRFLSEKLSTSADSPDTAFNRRWWALVLDQALQAVRADFSARGRLALFAALCPFLDDSRPGGQPLAATAQQLGIKETTLRVSLVRLRRQLADEIRAIILRTTGNPEAADEELRLFFER
jgi:DNA-directed RNA polymerase specialized sigma24 family protein